MILDPDNDQIGSMVQMWARYMLETGGTDIEVAGWQFKLADAFDPNLNVLYVKGLLSQDCEEIKAHLTSFRTLKTELRERVKALQRQAPFDLLYLDRLDVIDFQLQAALARAKGDNDAALNYAREASRLEGELPYSFGPPFVDYPSAQWLGELALENENYEEAVTAFTEQLQRTRRKRQAVEGFERAEGGLSNQP